MEGARDHIEALAVRVEQINKLVAIHEEFDPEGAASVRQATEFVVGVTFRVVQVFMGSGWRPRLVCFSHSAPARLAVHHRVLDGFHPPYPGGTTNPPNSRSSIAANASTVPSSR
jgi:Arabinose-binding domain of AraC transcription regulator, N-term